jgi:hypothetical protein
MAGNMDKYVNIITDSVTMEVIDTLFFSEIVIGFNIFDKVGLLIQRIEYELSTATLQDMDDDGDQVDCGLSTSSQITDIQPSRTDVIDRMSYIRTDSGTPGDSHFHLRPFIHDFSQFGGILVAPKPLFFAINSNGLSAVANVQFRLYFNIIKLTDAEYIELIETRRAFG